MITHIFSRLSWFTVHSLKRKHIVNMLPFTLSNFNMCCSDGTHSLSFVASSSFVSPVTLENSSYHTMLIKKHLTFAHCLVALTERAFGVNAWVRLTFSPGRPRSPAVPGSVWPLRPCINHYQENDVSCI